MSDSEGRMHNVNRTLPVLTCVIQGVKKQERYTMKRGRDVPRRAVRLKKLLNAVSTLEMNRKELHEECC